MTKKRNFSFKAFAKGKRAWSGRARYFNAPAVKPDIIFFWKNKNSNKIGAADILAPVINWAQSIDCFPK